MVGSLPAKVGYSPEETAKAIVDLLVVNAAIPPQGMSVKEWQATHPKPPTYNGAYLIILQILKNNMV